MKQEFVILIQQIAESVLTFASLTVTGLPIKSLILKRLKDKI